MNKISYFLAAGAAVSTLIFSAGVVNAETKVSGTIGGNAVWTESGSPYILEGEVTVSSSSSLTLEEGTSVESGSGAMEHRIIAQGGDIFINGSPSKRVNIGAIGGIFVSGGNIQVRYADMHARGIDLQLYNTEADISSSTFSGSTGTAIYAWKSYVEIDSSRIEDNQYAGIVVLSGGGYPSSMSIHDSAIINNGYSIYNRENSYPVQAQNNWWGSSDGPPLTGMNGMKGSVQYEPWLRDDPHAVCCSNILFLPGLEASRLYLGEERLWEPNSNSDVRNLYMDEDGKSIKSGIYSGSPIDSALGLVGIYGKFMDFLDGLVSKGIVSEWKPFGYDWRKPVVDIVTGIETKATGTDSLIEKVFSMASSSKTGRVSLIAHSNGGLVAKALVKKLAELGRDGLIDSVISVGVPYLGTPEAILALLHGGDQSIMGGLIATEANARGLARNMSSAYSLLPSAKFFSVLSGPTIAFASTSVAGVNDGSYARNLDSYEMQNDFVIDSKGSRQEPAFENTSLPIQGNKALAVLSGVLHQALDNFIWPESISRWAVAGVNAVTTRAIEYIEKESCFGSVFGISCGKTISHLASTTRSGDGTVLSPSASYDPDNLVSLDLKYISKAESSNIKHSNILESSTTQAIIDKIIKGESKNLKDMPGVTNDSYSSSPRYRISTHSPVELHLYDNEGRHTGLNGGVSGDGTNYFRASFEENIPGSSFRMIPGQVGEDTYIEVPADRPYSYAVKVKGLDFGYATLNIEVLDEPGDLVEYFMFPVTPFSSAGLGFSSDSNTFEQLGLDLDGDGTPDKLVQPNVLAYPPDEELSEVVLGIIEKVGGAEEKWGILKKKMLHIIDAVRKGKFKQAEKASMKLSLGMGHLDLDSLNAADKEKIYRILSQVAESAEALGRQIE